MRAKLSVANTTERARICRSSSCIVAIASLRPAQARDAPRHRSSARIRSMRVLRMGLRSAWRSGEKMILSILHTLPLSYADT